MRPIRPLINRISSLILSPSMNVLSTRVLIFGLIFCTLWLLDYSKTIVTTQYPAEYREGSILLMTDFFVRGQNPFNLENQPLMNNNYGFLYNLVVLPFAAIFGNSLAIHRLISILFIFLSSVLIVLTLIRIKVSQPFAFSGGILVMACLLFGVTPLARPDALGEFLFLAAILYPWYRGFSQQGLITGVVIGVFAFLAKPYFLLSIIIVAAYVYIFISKRRGFLYVMASILILVTVLFAVNLLFECYFLGAVLSNVGNSSLSSSHLWVQLKRFIQIFLPCLLIIAFDIRRLLSTSVDTIRKWLENPVLFDFIHPDTPLFIKTMNYFEFFLLCSAVTVVLLLGKHVGAYMIYFFQLIAPGLILSVFQTNNFLQDKRLVTVPLILANILIICFGVLYANNLSPSQRQSWEKLSTYVINSNHILNSPVLVAEMASKQMMPVDSGQSEYYFNIAPYQANPFAPEYRKVKAQGEEYLNNIQSAVQNKEYDYVLITVEQGFPFVGHQLIDKYYEPVENIIIAMPQNGQQWTIEVKSPRK